MYIDNYLIDFILRHKFKNKKFKNKVDENGVHLLLNENGDDEYYVGVDVIAEVFNQRKEDGTANKKAYNILNGKDKDIILIDLDKQSSNYGGALVKKINVEFIDKNNQTSIERKHGVRLDAFINVLEQYLAEQNNKIPYDILHDTDIDSNEMLEQIADSIKKSGRNLDRDSLLDIIKDYNDDYYALLDRYNRLKNSVVIRKNEYRLGGEYVKGVKYDEWINHIQKFSKK